MIFISYFYSSLNKTSAYIADLSPAQISEMKSTGWAGQLIND